MECREAIYSEEVYDFIIEYDYVPVVEGESVCMQYINPIWSVGYFKREGLAPLNVTDYTYTAIPSCFVLQNRETMQQAGILQMQNYPSLELKGRGVMVGIIASGERVIILSGIWN